MNDLSPGDPRDTAPVFRASPGTRRTVWFVFKGVSADGDGRVRLPFRRASAVSVSLPLVVYASDRTGWERQAYAWVPNTRTHTHTHTIYMGIPDQGVCRDASLEIWNVGGGDETIDT